MDAANTLLHAAAAALNPTLLQCALDAGADAQCTSCRRGLDRTALMLAIMHGGDHEATLGLVGRLLTTGTPSGINYQAATGMSALMMAAHLAMPTVVRTLIKAGANVEAECMQGETAWHKAQAGSVESQASRATIVCMLEAAGAVGHRAHGGIPMPRAVNCDAARFAAQYRSSMACILPGLVSHWPACHTADRWRSRADVIELLGGTTHQLSVQVSADNHIFPAVYSRKVDTVRMSAAEVTDATLFPSPIADAERGVDAERPRLSSGGAPAPAEAVRKIYCKISVPPQLEVGGLPLSLPESVFGIQPTQGPTTGGGTTFWMGSAGAVTPLHFDHCRHTVICQIAGRNRVTVAPPSSNAYVYPHSAASGAVRTSRVNLWAWSRGDPAECARHPEFGHAVQYECILSAGDVMYIPPACALSWPSNACQLTVHVNRRREAPRTHASHTPHVPLRAGWRHVEALEGNVSVLLPFDMTRAEQDALPRPWTLPDWGSLPDATAAIAAEAARAAEAAAASRASAAWLALHLLVHASSPSREAAPPCSSDGWGEHDGAARRDGLGCLRESFPLDDAQIASFRRDRHLRVAGMLPAAVLVEVRSRLIALASRATGGQNASMPSAPSPQPGDGAPQEAFDSWWASISEPAVHSWHMQQMWATDPVVRALVLSPRVGDVVCKLLGCDAVRLYHDNALSRAPGSKPTRWHCDDGPAGYMILGSPQVVTPTLTLTPALTLTPTLTLTLTPKVCHQQVVTVWVPLQRTTPTMGSLIFSERMPSHPQSKVDPQRPCPDAWDVERGGARGLSEQSDEYDAIVSSLFEEDGCVPSVATYELGDVSIHLTSCFHRTGPNMAGTPRMILAATFYADGVAARTDVDVSTMTQGQRNDWKKFAPGVAPGEPVMTWLNPLLPHAAPAPPRAAPPHAPPSIVYLHGLVDAALLAAVHDTLHSSPTEPVQSGKFYARYCERSAGDRTARSSEAHC